LSFICYVLNNDINIGLLPFALKTQLVGTALDLLTMTLQFFPIVIYIRHIPCIGDYIVTGRWYYEKYMITKMAKLQNKTNENSTATTNTATNDNIPMENSTTTENDSESSEEKKTNISPNHVVNESSMWFIQLSFIECCYCYCICCIKCTCNIDTATDDIIKEIEEKEKEKNKLFAIMDRA
jgi:hypothetical protein